MLAVTGLGLAAPIVVPPELESAVEGHTVFTVIEKVDANVQNEERYAAAVAVLVREITYDYRAFRFPGVVWFNDQYLVNPSQFPGSNSPNYRNACKGAVIAVPRGDPDPTADPNATFNQSNYVESYQIRDPNNKDWVIDKWLVNGRFVWSVAVMNTPGTYDQPDDGQGNCAMIDGGCSGPTLLPWDYEDRPSAFNDSGPADRRTQQCPVVRAQPGFTQSTYGYPCGGRDSAPRPSCAPLQYNAVLFFLLEDLTVAGPVKNHTAGSTDRQNDASGCHADINMTTPQPYNAWPCPGADDAREGNSHAYNPERPYPLVTYSGRNNHGGSADCTGDAVGDQYCHATREIDIYYGTALLPDRTGKMRFTDAEGSTAPYHCHETGSGAGNWCNQNDVFAEVGQPSP